MRLNARQWLAAILIFLGCVTLIPAIWKHAERFTTGTDYRIPYALSSDYWLYQRRLQRLTDGTRVPVIGDSVIWGEYVRPDGTLTHYLSLDAGRPGLFVNCGLNGIFPLAMEGLIANYGGSLQHRKVIVQYNMLWMSSPEVDLSSQKEATFNHTTLVPQGFGEVPCYAADASTRLGAVAERRIGFFGWVKHVDITYFDQLSLPLWTMEEDDEDPPQCSHAWTNPLAPITMVVPGEPANDPLRGPSSRRHRPWNSRGRQATHFDWVSLGRSLQWRAFQRTIKMLQDRDDNVFVIVGPFNEWMVSTDERAAYRQLRNGIGAWLQAQGIAYVAPETLPSDLYADASHPLTGGYALLAGCIWTDPEFRRWLGK
jgi:hypothetical protein